MITFKQFLASPVLLEKENAKLMKRAGKKTSTKKLTTIICEKVLHLLLQKLPKGFRQVGKSFGAGVEDTGVYQIRIANPRDKDTMDADKTLQEIRQILVDGFSPKKNTKKSEMILTPNADNGEDEETFKGLKASVNKNILPAKNSGRYKSVMFTVGDDMYEVILAMGGTKGDDLEVRLVDGINQLKTAVEKTIHLSNPEAEAALSALKRVHKGITLDNIESIHQRPKTRSTRRNNVEVGAHGDIIADAIITLKKPINLGGASTKIVNVSIKDVNGATFANFGLVDDELFSTFNDKGIDSLEINTESNIWKKFLGPNGFNLDKEAIISGLKHYADPKNEVKHPQASQHAVRIPKALKDTLRRAWGQNYIYLRKKNNSEFSAFYVDKEFVDAAINGLKYYGTPETAIRYPNAERKQIEIRLTNTPFGDDPIRYFIQLRHAKGGVIPREMKIKL